MTGAKHSDWLSVSIHAPREGCDSSTSPVSSYPSRFNSRTPGGVRLTTEFSSAGGKRFQFTHPGRGAT